MDQSNNTATTPAPVADTTPSEPQAPDQVQQQTAASLATESPPQQTQPTGEEQGDYITNVGQSMVDLLTDISMNDVMKQRVADRMRLPVEQITALCSQLLDKVDAGQLSEAELAFLISAPVADSDSDSTT